MLRKILVSFVVVAISACAWVSPSQESQYIALVKPNATGTCKKLGETRVKTLSKVVVVDRSSEKIGSELIILAKKEAVVMGGDTIAAKGGIEKGEQVFGVYQCQ